MTPLVVAHGGIGAEPTVELVAALRSAVAAGVEALRTIGTAADAVAAAVSALPAGQPTTGELPGCLAADALGGIAAGTGRPVSGRPQSRTGASGGGRYADADRVVLCAVAAPVRLGTSLARQAARRCAGQDAATVARWVVEQGDERGVDIAVVLYDRPSRALTVCHNHRFALVIGTEEHQEALLPATRCAKCWMPIAATLDPAAVGPLRAGPGSFLSVDPACWPGA